MGAFTDQLQKFNAENENYITFKLAKEQERATEKAQNLKFKNARVNIEAILIDYFKNIHDRNIKKSDFINLLKNINDLYINNNNFTNYQKDELNLFLNKKILQLKKAKLTEIKAAEKEAAAEQKRIEKQLQQKQKNNYNYCGAWLFWFLILWILFFIISM